MVVAELDGGYGGVEDVGGAVADADFDEGVEDLCISDTIMDSMKRGERERMYVQF